MRSVLMELLFLMFDLWFSPKKDYIKRQKFTEQVKELSFCHKLKFSNPYIYGTWCCRLLIFQTKIIWCNRIHSLKYIRYTTLGCRNIGIRKSEFVSKTQFLLYTPCIYIYATWWLFDKFISWSIWGRRDRVKPI